MATKKHDTFLMHLNHERMFTTVSAEQCQRLVRASFLLAKTGEVEDMSDDIVLDIFWEQISSFIIGNEKRYKDACEKKADAQRQRWEEFKELKAKEAVQNNTAPDDVNINDEFPFGRHS